MKKLSNNNESQVYSVVETPDGGYLLAGVTKTNYNAKEDIVLTKLDGAGNLLWTKAYGDTFVNSCAKIIPTLDGGYALAGYTTSFSSLGDMLVMKVDDTGKLLWSKVYGGTINWERARDIVQSVNGDLLISGYTGNYQDTTKTFFVRTDSAGNVLYTNKYLIGRESYGSSILELPDQSVVIGGDVYGADTMFAFAAPASYLLKLNASGNPLWAQAYALGWQNNLRSVVATYDGGFAVLTYTHDDTYWYAGIIKTDASGDTSWMKLYTGPYFFMPGKIIQAKDSGYVVTAGSAPVFFKTDVNGNVQWGKNVKTNVGLWEVIERPDGSYVFFGDTYTTQTGLFTAATDVNHNTCADSAVSVVHPQEYHVKLTPRIAVYGPMDSSQIVLLNSVAFGFQQTDLCAPAFINAPSSLSGIQVYPNPACCRVMISAENLNTTLLEVCVTDVKGTMIYKKQKFAGSSFRTQLDVSGWSKGIYFIKLSSDQNYEVRKLIVH